MAKILFNQNIDLCGFNIGNEDISYPSNQNNDYDVEQSTQNSFVFSFVGNDMYAHGQLYAQYRSQALSRDKFILYRQGVNDTIRHHIAIIGGVTNGFFDYNVSNNGQYKYTVETNPETKDSVSSDMQVTLETESFINPHWSSWSICDIEKNIEVSKESGIDVYVPSDEIFIIKNNVEAGSISDNLNIITYNTLGQYGNIMQTNQKFDSGNVSCLIDDFVVVQDIKCIQHIIVRDDIDTPEARDDFLLSVETRVQPDNCCFVFPKIDYTYYSYQPSNSRLAYKAVNVDESAMQNWSRTYDLYYEYDNESGEYKKLQVKYEVITSKPADWDEGGYLQYYVETVDGNYSQNVDSYYNANTKYYEQTHPEYKTNSYYSLVVNPWSPTQSKYVLANNIDKMNAWRKCLSNGKLKLLKAPNGQKWVVKINGQNTLDVAWHSSQYPSTISFTWQEILDINKISIIKW